MAADPIIYCLEQVTDYDQFERFCHDLMAISGYPEIEPLGGSKDKGRDALHVSRQEHPKATVFAYSVREDWFKKLREDAGKVKRWGHPCDRFVFLSTAYFTSAERDNAIASLAKDFGLILELYGLERLRVMLATTHEKVLAKHQQIFCPPFFPQAGGLSLVQSRDYIIVDCDRVDEALAVWLCRRLSLAGYRAWCRVLAPVAGSSLHDTVESLVRERGFRYLPILSDAALVNADYTARRAVAIANAKAAVVPIIAALRDETKVDLRLKGLEFIRTEEGWAKVLGKLLEVLTAANCPKVETDARIVLRSFIAPEVVRLIPEEVVSNRFKVLFVPEVVHGFNLSTELNEKIELEVKKVWGFRRVHPKRVLAFSGPPSDWGKRLGVRQAGGGVWKSVADIDGIKTNHLVPELIRKAMDVACTSKGLKRCEERRMVYFPENLLPSDRLYFLRDDGSKSFVNVAGRRKFWRPTASTYYRYHLVPTFSAQFAEDGTRDLAVLARIRVRITDDGGTLLPGRTTVSRRKHLCASWFNDEWLNRTIAIMQWLGTNGLIEIGSGDERIEVSSFADRWQLPVSINEAAIPNAKADREDLLAREIGDDQPQGDIAGGELE